MRCINLLLCFSIFGMIWLAPLAHAQPPRDQTESALATTSAAKIFQTRQIIDLSHSFDENTVYWPTEPGFKLLVGDAGITAKGYYYSANRFAAAEHGGTHIDAPIHFFKDRNTVDKIPLNRLIGEAAVVDVTKACAENRNYQIGITDLRRWETEHKRQLVDVIVLLRTGFADRWNDRASYLGTNKTGPEAVADLHFPGLDPEAARWLVEHRAIKSIGIDTPSIDYGQSQRFQSHVNLCKHNVPAFENVANVDKLPTAGATVVALPMKIGGGTGAPLRIIAMLPN